MFGSCQVEPKWGDNRPQRQVERIFKMGNPAAEQQLSFYASSEPCKVGGCDILKEGQRGRRATKFAHAGPASFRGVNGAKVWGEWKSL